MCLAEISFEHFPGRGSRQMLGKPHRFRYFVTGQFALAEVDQCLRVYRHAWFGHDDRPADFLPFRVRHADHRHFSDSRVLVENIFNLGRVDIFPA